MGDEQLPNRGMLTAMLSQSMEEQRAGYMAARSVGETLNKRSITTDFIPSRWQQSAN